MVNLKGYGPFPSSLEIYKDVEELCPDAWLISFLSPAGMVTEAVLRYSNIIKTMGLCHVSIGMRMGVADILDGDQNGARLILLV